MDSATKAKEASDWYFDMRADDFSSIPSMKWADPTPAEPPSALARPVDAPRAPQAAQPVVMTDVYGHYTDPVTQGPAESMLPSSQEGALEIVGAVAEEFEYLKLRANVDPALSKDKDARLQALTHQRMEAIEQAVRLKEQMKARQAYVNQVHQEQFIYHQWQRGLDYERIEDRKYGFGNALKEQAYHAFVETPKELWGGFVNFTEEWKERSDERFQEAAEQGTPFAGPGAYFESFGELGVENVEHAVHFTSDQLEQVLSANSVDDAAYHVLGTLLGGAEMFMSADQLAAPLGAVTDGFMGAGPPGLTPAAEVVGAGVRDGGADVALPNAKPTPAPLSETAILREIEMEDGTVVSDEGPSYGASLDRGEGPSIDDEPTAEDSVEDELAPFGIRNRRQVGMVPDRHHVLPQGKNTKTFFQDRGFPGNQIDDFTLELPEWEHQALHGGGNWKLAKEAWPEGNWNGKLMTNLQQAELDLGRDLTREEIMEIVEDTKKRFRLELGTPYVKYKAPR